MNEELKKLLGDAYHENMTAEEIQEAMTKLLLETGDYVKKGKSEAEKKKLEEELAKAKKDLQSKMTDDEKKTAEDKEKEALIEQLKQQLINNSLETNKFQAMSLTAVARQKAGIKDDDNDYTAFIGNIISDDKDKMNSIGNYINKMVQAAYDQGKAEMTKQKMGQMGSFMKQDDGSQEGGEVDKDVELGKQIAQISMPKKNDNNNYFKL